MKKKFLLLISLVMLLGMTSMASAITIPSVFDFEDYNTNSKPNGFDSNENVMGPVVVDQEHGTSFQLGIHNRNNSNAIFNLSPTINSGKFLLSFEINAPDTKKTLRIHISSPTKNSEAPNLFYMSKEGYICQGATSGAWSFPAMVPYELNRWYQIDILIDFDNERVYYFVDGVNTATQTLGFEDMNKIIFRSSEGIEGTEESPIYFDNMTFKFAESDKMTLSIKDDLVAAGEDTINVQFSDLIDQASLSNVVAYSLGTNPIAYQKSELDCEILSSGTKSAVVKFNAPFEADKIYKVEFPGLVSGYGGAYPVDSVYFAADKSKSLKAVLNADFSTATIGGTVTPTADVTWDRTSIYVGVAALDGLGDNVPGVYFYRRSSELKLWRTLTDAYTEDVTLEFKMRSEKPEFTFRVYDSESNYVDFVKVKADGFYYGEQKIADYSTDWTTVSVKLNQAEDKATIKIGETEVTDLTYQGLADVKKIEFVQSNVANATGNDRAYNELAYFKIKAVAPDIGATIVTFEDDNGKIYYPDDAITSKVKKVHVKFSGDIKPETLTNAITITEGQNTEAATYSYSNKVCTLDMPQYLWGSKAYTMTIPSTITNTAGIEIIPSTGVFTTASGVFEANALGIAITGGTVTINTEIAKTVEAPKTAYFAYAAYNNDFMVDFAIDRIKFQNATRKTTKNGTHTPAGAETAKTFLWSGLDTLKPMTECQAADVE